MNFRRIRRNRYGYPKPGSVPPCRDFARARGISKEFEKLSGEKLVHEAQKIIAGSAEILRHRGVGAARRNSA